MNKHQPIWRIYGISWLITVLLFGFVGFKAGLTALILVVILAGIEITFSFDNAVINAKILERMSPFWQRMFMTVGIFVAVFVVRVFLPIVIVALSAGLGFGTVTDLALNHPSEYAEKLETAHPIITSFGAVFLLMIFLDFVFEERKIKWLTGLENFFVQIGKIERVSVVIALTTLVTAAITLVHKEERTGVLLAGSIGLLSYLLINAIDTMFSFEKVGKSVGTGTNMVKAGLVGFLYLELIDASFSLDGVIGAFAITNDVLLIAVGLGVGAIYVRSMTVHMLRRGVLAKYAYMEHGAHYAIGILAVLMLASLKFDIPEAVSGLSGVAVITASLIHSHADSRRLKTS